MAVQRGLRLAAVVVLGYLCTNMAHVGFGQTPERCLLSGAVLNSATSSAIAHVLVSYNGPSSGYRFTDLGGAFRAGDVPCGSYLLSVSKPGFVSAESLSPQFSSIFAPSPPGGDEAEQSSSPPQPTTESVDVEPGSPPARIQLVPVSSIAGTVLDENGEPLAGVAVQGIAVRQSLDGTDYAPVRSNHTDDRGAYAFLDLTPGDYIVRLAGEAASTRYFMGSRLYLNNDHRGMQPVYYPNGDSPASAAVLHLGPSERASIDFRHATEAAFDIDGRLTGIAPGAWTRVQLYREGDRLPVGAAYVNLSSGQFRVVDVPRGSYTLRAVQYVADTQKWLAAETQVVVVSQPIRNLAIELSGGADIPVSVSYEAGADDNGTISLSLRPQHERSNVRHVLVGAPARPRPRLKGTPEPGSVPEPPKAFTNVIPDRYRLNVQTIRPNTASGYVASAKLGDVDVLHGEFSVSGSAPGELHLTVRGDSANLEGQLTFKGQPAPRARLYLIPTAGGGSDVKSGVSGADGHYQVPNLPPGEYRIQAWRGSPTPAEILAKSGETLTLQPGEHRMVTLEAEPAKAQPQEEEGDL
jgi:hypothetical protein